MRWTAKKEVTIHASHVLDKMPAGHQCARLHGHTYHIIIEVSSVSLEADTGMLVDFGLLSAYVKQFDHQHLNEFFQPTTAEVFARHLWDGLEKDILLPINRQAEQKDWVRLDAVIVKETETSEVVLRR